MEDNNSNPNLKKLNSVLKDIDNIKKKLNKRNEIKYHQEEITAVGIFQSGNIVVASCDGNLTIWDTTFKLMDKKEMGQEFIVSSIYIIDQVSFYTGSIFGHVQLWKEKKKYILNKNKITFEKELFDEKERIFSKHIHNDRIQKIILCDKNLYTCSLDGYIKITDIEQNYSAIKEFTIEENKKSEMDNLFPIYAILYIQDFKFLFASGKTGTYLWNSDFEKKKICDEEAYENSLQIFEKTEDSIKVICGYKNIIIICVDKNQEKVTQELKIENIDYECYCICVTKIKNKIILITGENLSDEDEENYKIRFYCKNREKFEVIYIYEFTHNALINGILNYGNSFLSFSADGRIIIWDYPSELNFEEWQFQIRN
jgi:WD40 repeat protein